MTWLFDRLFKRADIVKKGDLYLSRWFLGYAPSEPEVWRTRWYTRLLDLILTGGDKKKETYLHRMLQSDDDRDPHDHPWDFTTRVVWNGYDDESYGLAARLDAPQDDGVRTLTTVGRLGPTVEKMRLLTSRWRPAEWCHQVKKHNSRPTWTLVIRGPYRRDWGFVEADGKWVLWRDYLDFRGPDPYDPPKRA